ncbi:MAG: hypothetical protein HZA28_02345 [Candidatus Omnitrophica bacterium]|nr:hypothetical protein [Candidatus Omnitrophota bacterium]
MIKVDLLLAVAIFLSVPLCLVFLLWIFYNFRRGQTTTLDEAQVRQCPYCTHVFLSYGEGEIQMCPRCQSYIGDSRAAG